MEGSWFSFPALDNLLWNNDNEAENHHAEPFDKTYFSYSASSVGKCQVEKGDRVILPPSALKHLESSNLDYPMLFQLQNPATNFSTHCGVLEFDANEGTIYLPLWIMQNLMLENGDVVRVKSVALPKATFVKLQPHKKEFLKISDMKAVLETILQDFSCLTVGHSILVSYNNKEYELEVVEAKPSAAVSMVDTDCEVEFAKPLDAMKEERPTTTMCKRHDQQQHTKEGRLTSNATKEEQLTTIAHKKSHVDAQKGEASPSSTISSQPSKPPTHQPSFKPFTGLSRRLDGKPTTSSLAAQNKTKSVRFV